MKQKLHAVAAALMSKEARGPELAIFRIVVAALGVKLGINVAEWAK